MLSETRRGLEDFDNQHDFERLAADVLNALGYSDVAPMAPRGGSDGGRDINFSEGDTHGVALVTLDKKIREKFKRDLKKQQDANGVIALFCNVDVSPSLKQEFAKDALAKGYRLEVFDLERLRSLLDASLRQVRRQYLGIDDEVAARLRSEITRLLRFPNAVVDGSRPPTILEGLLVKQLPRRLFELLLKYDEREVCEVPGIGQSLHEYLNAYYTFRQAAMALEGRLMLRIGELVSVHFAAGWRIYLKYVTMRFAGASQEDIIGWGDFLNYSITWDDAENIFKQLDADQELQSEMQGLFQSHKRLSETVGSFVPQGAAIRSSPA